MIECMNCHRLNIIYDTLKKKWKCKKCGVVINV